MSEVEALLRELVSIREEERATVRRYSGLVDRARALGARRFVDLMERLTIDEMRHLREIGAYLAAVQVAEAREPDRAREAGRVVGKAGREAVRAGRGFYRGLREQEGEDGARRLGEATRRYGGTAYRTGKKLLRGLREK